MVNGQRVGPKHNDYTNAGTLLSDSLQRARLPHETRQKISAVTGVNVRAKKYSDIHGGGHDLHSFSLGSERCVSDCLLLPHIGRMQLREIAHGSRSRMTPHTRHVIA